MAEALAVASIVANVFQIVGFAGEVVERLDYCLGRVEDAPRLWKEIRTTLPILKQTVSQAKANAEANATSLDKNTALLALTDGCNAEVKELKRIVDTVIPKDDDSKFTKTRKALKSMYKDSKMERIRDRLDYYVQHVTNYQTTSMAAILIDRLEHEKQHQKEESKRAEEIMLGITQLQKHSEPVAAQLEQVLALLGELEKEKEDHEKIPVRQDIRTGFDNIPIAKKVGGFVDRPKVTQEIEDRLADPANTKRTVVLRGMGGNGKTQLAMDFALRALEKLENSYDSVFWVDATSEASALRSFQEMAEKLTHPAPKFDNDKARIEFVERKLKEWGYNFLMVLDNYDDVGAFKKHKLPAFMPHCRSGHYLITSRLSPYDQELGRISTFVVEVGELEEKEAVDLLVKKAFLRSPGPTGDHDSHAKAIVERLGYHALAIDLSAAYILKQTIGLHEFLGHFDKRKQKILSEAPVGVWEYQRSLGDQEQETNLAVFTSWELSYEKLQSDEDSGKAAACLLNLLAFLYKQGVSEHIFYWYHKSLFSAKDEFPYWLEFFVDDEDQWDGMKFGDAVSELRNRSLISSFERPGGSIRAITFHPLVKDWIKMRLGTDKGPSEEQRRLAVETTNLVHAFLKSQKTSVETFEMTVDLKPEALSYVMACQENLNEFCRGNRKAKAKRLGEEELADAGETFALFYEYMGKISEAEVLFTTLINWRKSNTTDEDSALLRAKSLYTEVLRLQKNFGEARRWDREVYKTRMDLLAEKGVTVLDLATYENADQLTQDLMKDFLWSSHDLGWDLEALGDVEEAEKLQRDAYDGRRQILGQNNPSTLQSTNNLAHTLRRQGKTLEALALMRETLQIGKNVFPTGHHSEILQFKSNLQDILRFNAELEEAEAMARESYADTCAEWGIDHLKAAASRGQLKDILWDRNKAKEAEKIATENLQIMANSPYSTDISRIDDIALLLDTLSGRQMTDGGSSRRDEILGHADRAYDLVKRLSPEDLNLPSTLQDLIYLSTGLEVLRASKQLIKLEPIIFEHCKKVFGISDRNSINSLVRLSSALRVEGKKKEADQECQKAIDELSTNLELGKTGNTKSTHLAALSWLAVLYKHTGDQRSAMEVYDKAFEYVMKDDFISNADYETLYSIQGLAEDIDDQRRCQKAEILHNAVLKTRESKYGEHPCVDDSLYAYSWNLRLQDRLREAEKVCQRALEIAIKFRGPHRNTMCILKRLAYLEEQLGKHELAEGHYREVLNGFRALGTRHITRVTEALEDLQELLMEQRKWEEARALIQDAMKRREEGWDRNMGHYAGLVRHLAIVTWEIGDGVEGLRLYRKARRTYEEAWGLDKMKEGRQKQNLIRRINDLLPGTENMEEEMRIEEEEAAQKADDAAAQKNADLDALDDGQKTPKAIRDVKGASQDIQQQMGPSHVGWDGTTQTYQMSTKSNQEPTVENGGLSLSRQTTLGANSLPEAPSHEPSKLNETSATLDEVTRRMGQASLGQ